MGGSKYLAMGGIVAVWMLVLPAVGQINAAAGDHCRKSFLEG